MDGFKSLWASKGVWGSLIALGSSLLVATGALAPAEAAAVQSAAGELVAQVVAVAGAAMALWGRIAATKALR